MDNQVFWGILKAILKNIENQVNIDQAGWVRNKRKLILPA